MRFSSSHLSSRQAFSLVELSIVLVILGLLVGGVLAGQSLIRAAELRRHINFHGSFTTIWMTFRDKYFFYPGDMPNATLVWGKYNSICPTAQGAVASPGTCDGNGDGKITWAGNGEMSFVAQQLVLAGLLSFSNQPNAYISLANGLSQSDYYSLIGSTSNYADLYANTPPLGTLQMGNALQTSRYNALSAGGSNQPISSHMKPEDTWSMDTKMDDGNAVAGNFRAANGLSYGQTAAVYDNCLTLSSGTYVYSLSNNAIACRYVMKLP